MSTFRKTGIVGTYEIDNILEVSSIDFAEWHNGEGLDFTIFDDKLNETKRFSLTLEQLNALAVIGEAIGFIEMEEVKNEAKKYQKDSEDRQRRIEQIRSKYNSRDEIDRFDSDVPF